jgi:hypothetical protein
LHGIVTLVESWFYYITDHEFIWLLPDGKIPDRERVTSQQEKVMTNIMWSRRGFAVVTTLESWCKFNAGYYVSKLLTTLSEWWRGREGGHF